MKNIRTGIAVLFVVLATGCVGPRRYHPHGMPPGQAKKIVHVHGHHCGHSLVDGLWVVVHADAHPGKGRKNKH